MFVASVVCFAKSSRQRPVVVGQFGDHIQWLRIFGVVIENALKTGDLADRLDCKSADLSNSLCDWVSHREKLVAVFVEQ
jgi:hypothetical protein